MPDYDIIVSKRIDEPGFRWRLRDGRTGVIDYDKVQTLIEALTADNPDSVKLDDQDRGWLASEVHRSAYTKSPEDRTSAEQEMAEEIGGAIIRSGGEDGDFPWRLTPPNYPLDPDYPATPEGFAAAQAEADRMADEENERIADNAATDAVRKLLADWFNGELSRISEYGGSRDWEELIGDAKARHETFGVPWSNAFVPKYLREILALNVEEN